MHRRTFFAVVGAAAAAAPALTRPTTALGLPLADPSPMAGYGTFDRPFGLNSLLNMRPVNPRFDAYQIPDHPTTSRQDYRPGFNQSDYGITVIAARPGDKSVTIRPRHDATLGVSVPIRDNDRREDRSEVVVPHFPDGLLPPAGTDGSVAIVDGDRVYNFWQLRREGNDWTAANYGWSPLQGDGFADPAHYYQGARAIGCCNLAGLIRKQEFLASDEPTYPHALALTLDCPALAPSSADPRAGGFTYPATLGDGASDTVRNVGRIPEGALLMLPPSFPVDALPSRELRKIARTLQTYGGYVVDRNGAKSMTIEIANEPGFNYSPGGTGRADTALLDALDTIRRGLRRVVSCDGYRNAKGELVHRRPGWDANLLSLRGPWHAESGAAPVFASERECLSFPRAGEATFRGEWQSVNWALLQPGERFRLTVESSSAAGFQLQLFAQNALVLDSRYLGNRETFVGSWPSAGPVSSVLIASSTTPDGWVKVDLRRV